MYTNILHHWTTILQSIDSLPAQTNQMITDLSAHVNSLVLSVIQMFPSISIHSAVLEFYEQYCRIVADDDLVSKVRIELPPPLLVYTLFFNGSLATVSRLCQILARYKKGFELAMSIKSQGNSQGKTALSYNRAYVGMYNGFLMDICNCFWRTRAFGDTDPNAQGCLVPRPTVTALVSYVPSVEKTFNLASLFSFSYSPVLCLFSIQSLRALEDAETEIDSSIETRHAGPVTQSSLAKLSTMGGIRLSWQDYRIGVLESLGAQGFGGVAELLKNTMTVLKNAMDGSRGSQGRLSQ
jgi:centromere protein I